MLQNLAFGCQSRQLQPRASNLGWKSLALELEKVWNIPSCNSLQIKSNLENGWRWRILLSFQAVRSCCTPRNLYCLQEWHQVVRAGLRIARWICNLSCVETPRISGLYLDLFSVPQDILCVVVVIGKDQSSCYEALPPQGLPSQRKNKWLSKFFVIISAIWQPWRTASVTGAEILEEAEEANEWLFYPWWKSFLSIEAFETKQRQTKSQRMQLGKRN